MAAPWALKRQQEVAPLHRLGLQVARAEALLGSARAYAFEVIGDIWATLVGGRPLTLVASRLQIAGHVLLATNAYLWPEPSV